MDLVSTSAAIKRLIYLSVVTALAFLFQSQVATPTACWLVWAMLLAALITTHHTWSKRLITMVTSCLLATAGVLISSYIAAFIPLLCLYLFLVTVVCMYLSEKYPSFLYPFFLINLLILLSSGFVSEELENLERSIFVLMGFSAAIVLQMLWWPFSYKDDLRQSLQTTIACLRKLNRDIFACLQVDYSENIYLHEKRIHASKNQFIQSIANARALFKAKAAGLNEAERSKTETALIMTDKLFDLMLDYSQIRRRVTDTNTFTLCGEELTAIGNEIDQNLCDVMHLLRHKKVIVNSKLDLLAKHLENNYQNVLRVSAREPLVFLLFMFSLKAFNEEIGKWVKELNA